MTKVTPMLLTRMLPLGAELNSDGTAHLRVWAPRSEKVAAEIFAAGKSDRVIPLIAESGGYFSGSVPEVAAGVRYKFRLDHGSFPDPASRFQPDGPPGAS